MHPHLAEIEQLLRRRDVAGAERHCRAYLERADKDPEAHLLMARIRQARADFDGMRAAAERAIVLRPDETGAKLLRSEALLHLGHIRAAVAELEDLEAGADSRLLQHLGALYTHAGKHEAAYRVYDAARQLNVDDPGVFYNLATAAMALGRMNLAEALFDHVLVLNPMDADAAYNRATLRKQTSERNHVAGLETMLARPDAVPAAKVQLHYALAKELEDLGDARKSFGHLKAGADLRAAMLSYKVEDDVATMRLIAEQFTGPAPEADPKPGPIFVVGLPRTGTTLVDRILGSHSAIESLGEINDFALALTRLAGPSTSKAELVAKCAALDFDALGAAYRASTTERTPGAAFRIDKTPANFLYLGLIARALPEAKIVHLRRDPMDAGYAIYKTLFRMGYPYSYGLEDLGDYIAAYRRLMDHWRTVLPGRILDIEYERLVTEIELETRRLLTHCGPAFEPGCLDFHLNRSASATASAAQVRQPLHRESVGKWRRYEAELTPLRARLELNGVALAEPVA